MTVSANPTPDFSRDQILEQAIRMTGILNTGKAPKQAEINLAAIDFNLELQTLQAEGVILRTIERADLALVAGTAEYTLSSNIIDLELGQDDTIGTIRGSTGAAETQVKTMSRGEYLQLAVKDTVTGLPARCYVEKQAQVKLIFWPIPDSSTATFRYTGVRLLRGGDTGLVTMDLLRTWTQYLVFAVASCVAFRNSLFDRGNYLRTRADKLLEKCKAGDVQHGNITLRVGHNGVNWR
jgi:hypothetical protein